jgi:hypothetical protein
VVGTGSLLRKALREASEPPLRPLPEEAAALLERLEAPPRLAAHLRAVHDVACELAGWLERQYPGLVFSREAARFGAATHDIGKIRYIAELSGPGSEHEEAGRQLLLAEGYSAQLARFAATHASWTAPDVGLEDLAVSVADKIWKNKRVPELEDLLVTRLARASGREAWEEFLALDEVLGRIGDGADGRLAFQASFPVRR